MGNRSYELIQTPFVSDCTSIAAPSVSTERNPTQPVQAAEKKQLQLPSTRSLDVASQETPLLRASPAAMSERARSDALKPMHSSAAVTPTRHKDYRCGEDRRTESAVRQIRQWPSRPALPNFFKHSGVDSFFTEFAYRFPLSTVRTISRHHSNPPNTGLGLDVKMESCLHDESCSRQESSI